MRFCEITEGIEEGFVQIAGRSGNRIVRKYRCTSGARRGRIVAKPGTCSAPKSIGSSINIKKARRRKGSQMTIKALRTKRATRSSQRLATLNVHARSKLKPRRKGRRR